MKDSIIKNIIVNLRALATMNIRKEHNCNAKRITDLEETISYAESKAESDFRRRFLYHSIISHYAMHQDEALLYKKELEYLIELGSICTFPYPHDSEKMSAEGGFDNNVGLPYVLHNNKRLYYPVTYSVNDAIFNYRYLICDERLLEVGENNAPHQYQSPSVRIEDGDTLFDIGSAEGLFALDNIDRVSHAVIIESSKEWINPLKHTFAPFRQKVDIIQGFISSTDTDKTISLHSLLSRHECPSMFVKLDIEGYELPSLLAAKEFLNIRNGIKLSVASYHKQQDYDKLKLLFDEIGYHSESSHGYMIFHMYDMPVAPYFRHGIIRAVK